MLRIKRIPLIENNIYHLFNRGARQLDIFRDKSDYQRFLQLIKWHLKIKYPYSLFLERTNSPKINIDYVRNNILNSYGYSIPQIEIYAFVLMPNHFHFGLKQLQSNGITTFMRELSTGYSMYFNRKYHGSGSVFQGRFKSVEVASHEQFIQLCRYIHINPFKSGIKSSREQMLDFPWSSFPHYLDSTVKQTDLFINDRYLRNSFQNTTELINFTLSQDDPKKELPDQIAID